MVKGCGQINGPGDAHTPFNNLGKASMCKNKNCSCGVCHQEKILDTDYLKNSKVMPYWALELGDCRLHDLKCCFFMYNTLFSYKKGL